MTILRAYRTALDPTTEQRKRLVRQAGASCWVYNWALSRWRELYEASKAGGPKPSAYAIHRSLTPLKRTPALAWLSTVSSYAVREAVNDVGAAYGQFYRRLKCGFRGKAAGVPQFRPSRGRRARSFRVAQPDAIEVRDGSIKIAGVGWVRLHEARYIPPGANYRGLACRQEGQRWYVAVQVEEERGGGPRARVVQAVSVELAVGGLEGLRSAERTRKLWERRSARRFKSGRRIDEQSRGWREAVRHAAALQARCRDIRRDRLQQFTTRLVRRARGATMILPHVEGPTLSGASAFELRRQIEYKQRWRGASVEIVPSASPSTPAFAGGSSLGGGGGQAGRRKTAPRAVQRPAEPDQLSTRATMLSSAAPDGGSAVSAALTSLGSGNRADRETSSSEKRGGRPRATGRAVSARQQSSSSGYGESREDSDLLLPVLHRRHPGG